MGRWWNSGAQRHASLWLMVTMATMMVFVEQADAVEKVHAASVLNTTGNITIAPSIAAALAIAVGALVCFYGFKLLRPVVFICGFVFGGLVVALIIEYAFATSSWMATASWIGFLAAGAITGFMALLLYNVGLFLVGALAGILLAFTFNTSFGYRLYPSQPDIMLVIMVIVLGLLFGILAWKLEKPVVILATSFIGATAIVYGLGYFAGKYPSGADLKRLRSRDPAGDWIYTIPAAWWAYLAANIVLFLIGVIVQFRKTARETSSPTIPATTARAASPEYQPVATPPFQRPRSGSRAQMV